MTRVKRIGADQNPWTSVASVSSVAYSHCPHLAWFGLEWRWWRGSGSLRGDERAFGVPPYGLWQL